MNTTKEIFDYLVAKYPNEKVHVTHTIKTHDQDKEYFSASVGDNWQCTRLSEGGSIQAMLDRIDANMPKPESRCLAAELALKEAKQRAESAAAELAALEAQMQKEAV